MTDWAARLAHRRAEVDENISEVPGSALPKPPEPPFVSFGSTQGEPFKNIPSAPSNGLRAHLLALAEGIEVSVALVHNLPDDDIAACAGENDDTLRAYLRGIVRQRDMTLGIVPEEWTSTTQCDGCGPVWIWPGAPPQLIACPWCFRRRAGTAIPKPTPAP